MPLCNSGGSACDPHAAEQTCQQPVRVFENGGGVRVKSGTEMEEHVRMITSVLQSSPASVWVHVRVHMRERA